MTAWAEQVSAEIGRLGGRAPSARALIGTEQRIAELVAAGRTNRRSPALFVIVEAALLWKVSRKLDVRSRTSWPLGRPMHPAMIRACRPAAGIIGRWCPARGARPPSRSC